MWPGMGLSLKVEKILYEAKSEFQDICVFESESFGNVLLLDGQWSSCLVQLQLCHTSLSW